MSMWCMYIFQLVFFFPPFFGKYTKEELVVHMAILRASLVAQLIKNPPAIQETTVQFLGWEDPLEKGRATSPEFWSGEFHGLYSPWGGKESDVTE